MESTESKVTHRRVILGYISIVVIIISLSVGITKWGLDPHMPLVLATTIIGLIVVLGDKQKWDVIESEMINTISLAMQAIVILMIIGMVISSWLIGGIVPAMIYYGLEIINPKFFYFTALVLSSVIAISIGSSWTTAGTIGVALIGIATALGLSVPMAAGAIISGAYFGDKLSPLSDTTNLAPTISGAKLFDHIKSMTYTTIPTFIIVSIILLVIGFTSSVDAGAGDSATVLAYQGIIQESFNISLFLLLPPLLIIAMIIFKVPAIPGLMGSIFLGLLFGFIFQDGVTMSGALETLHYGYEFDPASLTGTYTAEDIESVTKLLSRGGLDSMMWTVSLIIVAMTMGGLLEASGFLESIVSTFKPITKNATLLVTVSILTGIFVNIVCGDQFLAIILPGRMFKDRFEELDLHPKVQSRILESGGTMTSALVPWNTCGATMSSFLGVPTLTYLPYCFMNLLNPLMEIVAAMLGFAMFKRSEDPEFANEAK